MTFSSLKTKIADYLARSDLSSQIEDFINSAMHQVEKGYMNPSTGHFESLIWRRAMEVKTTGTSTNDYIAFPTRYKEVKSLFITDDDKQVRLVKQDYGEMIEEYNLGTADKRRPIQFAPVYADSKFYLRPYPDKTYSYELISYNYSADLAVSTNENNWWTDNAWEILLYGALLESKPYLFDDIRIPIWEKKYLEQITLHQTMEKNEIYAGSIQKAKVLVPV